MMSLNRKEIPLAIRDLVIQDWKGDQNSKMSLMQIGKKYKLAKSTVQKIIYNIKTTGSIQNKPGKYLTIYLIISVCIIIMHISYYIIISSIHIVLI